MPFVPLYLTRVPTNDPMTRLDFISELEVRYTGTEMAADYYERSKASLPLEFDSEDCHILRCAVNNEK